MEGRLPPSFTPHPPTPLSLSLLLPVPLLPPLPLPFLPRKGSLVAVVISHPGSLFSYITRCVESWNGASPGGPPLFVITRSLVKTHFEWLSPPPPLLSFFTSVEEVAALVFTRRGVFVEAAGPELRWARTSIFGIRLSANDRARIFLLVSRGNWVRHNEIETEANIILLDQEIYLNYSDRSISSNKFIVIVTG